MDTAAKNTESKQNPLRPEGLLIAARGTVVALLGGLCLLQVSWLSAEARHTAGTADLVVGVLLLTWGLTAVARGLVQSFQFSTIRYLPAGLAPNQTVQSHPAYTAAQLRDALLGRRYMAPPVPRDVLARGLYSFFPGLLYLMPPMRIAFENLVEIAAGTLVAFFSFALAWFSIATGVAPAAKLFWFHLMMGGLLIYVAVLWLRQAGYTRRLLTGRSHGSKRIAVMLGLSAAIPLLFWLLPTVRTGYETEVPVEELFPATAALALLAAGAAAYIVKSRAGSGRPAVDPSLLKTGYNEQVHPNDLFLLLQRQDLAGTSFPNRLYQNIDLGLFQQGGQERGAFAGELLHESEPTITTPHPDPSLRRARLIATIAGESLIAAAALLLYLGVNQVGTTPLDLLLCNFGSFAFLLWLFGSRLSAFAHLFWSEVFFNSILLYFQAAGSYEQSKITAGAAYADTLRSENTLVRSNIRATFACAHVRTATLARYGDGPLDFYRYILAVESAPEILARVTGDLQVLFANGKTIASYTGADANALTDIQRFNEVAARRRNVEGGSSDAQLLRDSTS